MTTTPTFDDTDCASMRAALEARFDGHVSVGIDSEIADHMATCRACNELARDLSAADRALQDVGLLEFSADAMEQVIAQTVGLPVTGSVVPDRFVPHAWRRATRRLATAAVLLLAVGLPWVISQRAENARALELERAVAETEYVLNVASNAVRRVENVTVHEVMQGHITGAVRRIPARWAEVSLSLFGR